MIACDRVPIKIAEITRLTELRSASNNVKEFFYFCYLLLQTKTTCSFYFFWLIELLYFPERENRLGDKSEFTWEVLCWTWIKKTYEACQSSTEIYDQNNLACTSNYGRGSRPFSRSFQHFRDKDDSKDWDSTFYLLFLFTKKLIKKTSLSSI